MNNHLEPGDYVGLFLEDKLIYSGVLKDVGVMQSGRMNYQILLVKNIFQRNYPEIHFDADVRRVNLDDLKAEVRSLKMKLQKHIEKPEPEHVHSLISEHEIHSIVG